MVAARNNRGMSHENGDNEGPQRHLRRRLEQLLIQRGSREFSTVDEYRQLLGYESAHASTSMTPARCRFRDTLLHMTVLRDWGHIVSAMTSV